MNGRTILSYKEDGPLNCSNNLIYDNIQNVEKVTGALTDPF